MDVPRTYKGVINHFKSFPEEIQQYFEHLPSLIENYPWEISISYLFTYLEYAQNLILYCAITKLHRAESELTWDAISKQHIKRDTFEKFFKNALGKAIPDRLTKTIQSAQKTRNEIIHGKDATDAEMRKAVVEIIEYAKGLNEFVQKIAGFQPFGNLTGFTGRRSPLDKSTTRWVLKGMGFDI